MLLTLFTLLTFISAILHIRAEYHGPRWQVYIFKPLALIFILSIAIVVGRVDASSYKLAIVAGLLFSLVGDVFLMLPGDRFVAGLISFLIAHVFYIFAFTSGVGVSLSLGLLIPLLIYGIFMLRLLSPHLGRMRIPVWIYLVVILTMVWQAWARMSQTGQLNSMLAAVGATLFAISDSVLAVNRFRSPFRSAQAIILSTYFAAQWLIANSMV